MHFRREHISRRVRSLVMERDGHRCRYCWSEESLVIDHVTPLAAPTRDGWTDAEEVLHRNSLNNLVACCAPCNTDKGAKVDWIAPNGLRPVAEFDDANEAIALGVAA